MEFPHCFLLFSVEEEMSSVEIRKGQGGTGGWRRKMKA